MGGHVRSANDAQSFGTTVKSIDGEPRTLGQKAEMVSKDNPDLKSLASHSSPE